MIGDAGNQSQRGLDHHISKLEYWTVQTPGQENKNTKLNCHLLQQVVCNGSTIPERSNVSECPMGKRRPFCCYQ
jgi:hypothetical protein